MNGRQTLIVVPMIAALTLWAGCNLFDSSNLPSGYFDRSLLETDPTAAARDYVRRTPTHDIHPDEVLRAVIVNSSDPEVGILQQHKSIPVYGGSLYLRLDNGTGLVTKILKDEWQEIGSSTSIQPTLTADQARTFALIGCDGSFEDSSYVGPSLRFLAPGYLPGIDALHLAWEIHLRNDHPEGTNLPEHLIVDVDAHTGTLLYISANQVVE